MAAPIERSKPPHNFKLPLLKWRNQRALSCMRLYDRRSSLASGAESAESNHTCDKTELIDRRSSPIAPHSSKKSLPLEPICSRDSDGIEAVREKLMLDLKVAAEKMISPILEEKVGQDSSSEARPWNLRARITASKEPNESIGGEGPATNGNCSSQRPEAKSSRLRSLAAATEAMTTKQSGQRRGESRPKFSIALSQEKIEADFRAIAGVRPPRRPKKRPKIVQREIDAVLPGLRLTEITPETYKVPDINSGQGKS